MKLLKIHILLLISGILFVSFAYQHFVTINGKQYWLNGINLPWIRWEDFDDPWGSNNYNHDDFEAAFKKYSENGINSVRIWIHCAGEGSPVLDAQGNVTGTSTYFWDNFGDMLDLAKTYDIFVMPALFSFDILNSERSISTYPNNTADNFHALVASEQKTQTYIDSFLIELLERFDNSSHLFCWEICNEPEWMSENYGANADDVIRFHAQIAAAIHKNGSKPVTTGAASLKWHGVQYDYWSDEALQQRFNDGQAYFDIFQIHYYDWMDPSGQDEYGFNPWFHTPDDLGLGHRPVIIGETPGNGGDYYTCTEMYEIAYDSGYAGVFAWSDQANDGEGSFSDISPATNYMYSNYKEYIDGSGSTAALQSDILNSELTGFKLCPIFNPSDRTISINLSGLDAADVKLTIFDSKGRPVANMSQLIKNRKNIIWNVNYCNEGFYFIRLIAGKKSFISKLPIIR